ncbi:hypothetical protein [Streptosporangium subroseum]|uniref:hypothetical protein n=1 Tax=Streptosporangium subroseum TaxID=106412 RepID=UPI0030857B53|nr:hypothetical protein OHB15_25270 [Streptosporangium subroseum]
MSDITGPPIARVDVVRDVHHGITLDDAYRWMETDGEEFHRWLDGQAGHAREQLDTLPRREELLTRIRSWWCRRTGSGCWRSSPTAHSAPIPVSS